MIIKRMLKKEFFITLCCIQNKWHRYGVFRHTIMVVYHVFKAKQYKMISAGFLHDIGKPFVAYQDEEDIILGEYSFTNHEEISYRIIKNWPFVSRYTKNLVRYHYLLRGMENAKRKKQLGKYNRMKRFYDKLDYKFIDDLKQFLVFDDLAKK